MYTQVVNINNDICKLLKNSLYYGFFTCVVVSQALIQPTPLQALNTSLPIDTPNIANSIVAYDYETENINWEKDLQARYKNARIMPVADGIKHIKITRNINSQPIRINIVEVNKRVNPQVEFAPVLASEKLARKDTIRNIAQKNKSIVAINGTYFSPPSGIPLGTLMIDKKLYTGPIYDRVAMGIFENDFQMSRTQLDAIIRSRDGASGPVLRLDNINQPRMLSTYVLLYTKEWGPMSPPSPKYGIQIAVENNQIKQVSNGAVEIPQNGYVISGPKEKLEPFFNAKNLDLEIKTNPEWNDVKHIISGGPYLVKNGEIYVDAQAQKLNSVTGKNPRTAIGYTADKNLILITIDGREENSVGMTLNELAKFMRDIGCVYAMNLDGGGSSIMYVNGAIANNPSIKGGIAISNIFSISINDKISYSYSK